jgi:hypothetical protein
MGHYATDCTKPRRQTGDQLLMKGVESGEFNGDDGYGYSGFSFFNDACR